MQPVLILYILGGFIQAKPPNIPHLHWFSTPYRAITTLNIYKFNYS